MCSTNMQESLAALELMMEEFFSGATTNARKAEIERVLAQFASQDSAWQDCLYFMGNTHNHYVSMYSLTSLESVIGKRWVGMFGQDKMQIRSQLTEFLMKRHSAVPRFIMMKVVKLLVDIASTDWPHFYPDFLSNILNCIRKPDMMLLGLTMLHIASEELATPRDTVVSARKDELKRLLTNQVAQILSTLCSVLEVLLPTYHRLISSGRPSWPHGESNISATPPPSPSMDHHEDAISDGQTDGADDLLFFSLKEPTPALLDVVTKKILANQMPSGQQLASPPDCDVVEALEMCLKCVCHIFSWIPLTTEIENRLLKLVFHCASLGLLVNSPEDSFAIHTRLSIMAMCTINEIVYRQCVPADSEVFLLRMFHNAHLLLKVLVGSLSGREPTSCAQLPHPVDHVYVDKFTEFLHSFVQNHLRRFETNAKFPILEFLGLLFKYTFGQTSAHSYLDCLEIWVVCVDYASSGDRQVLLSRYREPLYTIAIQVLSHFQLRCNDSKLGKLDDQVMDDNDETEWQHYLRASIELIVKVAEVLPGDIIHVVDAQWKEALQLYLQLDKYIVDNRALVLASEAECLHLHHLLRDFSSLLQLVGRLCPLFTGEVFQQRFESGLEVIKNLILLAMFGSKNRLYALATQLPILSTDLAQVHSQALATLKAWCHWLAQLHNLAHRDESYQQQCKDLTSRITLAVVPIFREEAAFGQHNALLHSAAHFMATLTGTVRPPSIWKLKEFTDLYSQLNHIKLQPEDHLLLVRALTNVLLLPWPGIPDQRWDERSRHLAKFLGEINQAFTSLVADNIGDLSMKKEEQTLNRSTVIHTLRLLADLVDNILSEVTQTKRLCYDCIKDYMAMALRLFPIYLNDGDVCEQLFSFFHVVMDVLKSQIGAESVEQILSTFLTLFTKQQLQTMIVNDEHGSGVKVVEKFLSILQFVVKENDASFRRFIDTSMALCLNDIYPLVAEKPSADIKGALYQVLANVLIYNWRHFFRSSAVRTLLTSSSPGSSPSASIAVSSIQHSQSPSDEAALQHNHFMKIMQAFGQSFLQPDITLFRQNLDAMEKLNEKWGLYQKPIFTQSALIVQFLSVFLRVLAQKSHDLLKEELIVSVYNMARVDFPAFFNSFLPHFLSETEGLDVNQKSILQSSFKKETDLPTFVCSVERFINDLRYYKLCNASLPSGSVLFSI